MTRWKESLKEEMLLTTRGEKWRGEGSQRKQWRVGRRSSEARGRGRLKVL
tara:strand:+ start:259 stop:408 length:150 start_codon:yes stop_codon:yes gene_type:complete